VNRPKGQLTNGARSWEIQSDDQLRGADEYRPVIVAYRNGAPVRISDVASVDDSVEDLRTAGLLAHIQHQRADAVADAERLARQQFVAAQQRLGTGQIDRDVAELHALDQTVDDLALAVLEFLELALALGFAHFLHDHLLGGLGGDAAEIDRRQFLDQEIAEFLLRIGTLRIG